MGGMLGNFKSLAGLLGQVSNIEVQKKMIELQADAMELLEEHRSLKDENAELRRQLKTRESLRFRNNFYWSAGDDGNEEGPFCSACSDDRGKLVHLHEFESNFGCPSCGLVRDGHGQPVLWGVTRQFNMDRG